MPTQRLIQKSPFVWTALMLLCAVLTEGAVYITPPLELHPPGIVPNAWYVRFRSNPTVTTGSGSTLMAWNEVNGLGNFTNQFVVAITLSGELKEPLGRRASTTYYSSGGLELYAADPGFHGVFS